MKRLILLAFILLLNLTLSTAVCGAGINEDLLQAIKAKDIQKVKELLSRGADVNAMGKNIFGVDNITPLSLAASDGDTEIVRLLLEKGANVNFRHPLGGGTPLTDAAMPGHTEIVRLLLEKGADINAKDEYMGYTALMNAAFAGRTETMRLLVEKGAGVNDKAGDGSTPLHIALILCRTETVKLLLEKGADVNAKDNNGSTPLMFAITCPTEIAKLLIKKGADVNAKNNYGSTVLYQAELNADSDMIEFLRQSGATGGKLPKQVPSKLTSPDIKFLSEQCAIDRSDIDIIPQLDKKVQRKLFARIAMKDCKLMSSFKASRSYYKQLKPNVPFPMPPAGWNAAYLTSEELDNYKKMLDSAPW